MPTEMEFRRVYEEADRRLGEGTQKEREAQTGIKQNAWSYWKRWRAGLVPYREPKAQNWRALQAAARRPAAPEPGADSSEALLAGAETLVFGLPPARTPETVARYRRMRAALDRLSGGD